MALNEKEMFRANGTEIRGSRRKYLFASACGLLMTWAAWDIALNAIRDSSTFDPKYWIAAFGLMFFGFVTLVLSWKVLFGNELLYIVSPKGVWMASKSGGVAIPWEGISRITREDIGRQRYLVLEMTKESYEALDQRQLGRVIFKLNGFFGVKGIPLSAQQTNVTFERLEEILRAHQSRWKNSRRLK